VNPHEDDDDRCDDRREFEHEQDETEIARSRSVPFGEDYVQSLVAVQDAQVPGTALALLVPGLHHRWPEPRVLWQDEVWWTRDRCRLDIEYASQDDLRWLLGQVRALAPELHAVAARDEDLMTSSGLRRTLAAAGIRMIRDTDPMAWAGSTVLVRSLRARCL